MKRMLAMGVVLLSASCGTDNPLKPSMVIVPDATTVSIGQSQVFVVYQAGDDVLFKMSSDAGDWHQFVKATGQAHDRIELTGVQPTGDREVSITAQPKNNSSKTVVAVLRVVR